MSKKEHILWTSDCKYFHTNTSIKAILKTGKEYPEDLRLGLSKLCCHYYGLHFHLFPGMCQDFKWYCCSLNMIANRPRPSSTHDVCFVNKWFYPLSANIILNNPVHIFVPINKQLPGRLYPTASFPRCYQSPEFLNAFYCFKLKRNDF